MKSKKVAYPSFIPCKSMDHLEGMTKSLNQKITRLLNEKAELVTAQKTMQQLEGEGPQVLEARRGYLMEEIERMKMKGD